MTAKQEPAKEADSIKEKDRKESGAQEKKWCKNGINGAVNSKHP